jgi:hypothetical protein
MKFFSIAVPCILVVVFAHTFRIIDYWDKTAPFQLTIANSEKDPALPPSQEIEIAVNSEKYRKLLEWSEKQNLDEWTPDDFAYNSNVFLNQDNLYFLFERNRYVVVGFVDDDIIPRKYSRKIEVGELDFLLE